MEELKNSICAEVFQYFKEMNKIPRGSGNEKELSDWLVGFAKEHSLDVTQDKAMNIIIRKPGSAGYENAPTVILQGHMDMVCEKEEDKEHDFLKDPIDFIVEGDKIHADRTTLGADNGIAVSYGLAILASHEIAHPPIELLITVSEETGMDGAFALDASLLSGRRLINIDAEEEGKLLVSCAGGIGATLKLPIEWEDAPESFQIVNLVVDGLQGGHSGVEINKQRGSASKIMGRILLDLERTVNLSVFAINGGTKHNAIPRKAVAGLLVKSEEESLLKDKLAAWTLILQNELQGVDDGVQLSLKKSSETVKKVFSAKTTHGVIQILNLIPAGVINMSSAIPGLVQTSSNLGVVLTLEDMVTFENTIRSSVRSNRTTVADEMGIIGEVTGAKVVYASEYPEWQYNPSSKLREVFVDAYNELYGKKPEITAIHAGLECGLFSEKFDGKIDLISFGPNLYDVHTPKEYLSISSVERTWTYLLKVLEKLNQ
jgi:dipeptidase D